MATCYIELRKTAAKGTDSVAADIMRHLHTRQHLGKAVVVNDQPVAILGAARKQWLKLSRAVQKQRASTLNADKILKLTHTITHMQHMHFTAKTPLEQPDADIYFLSPSDLSVMPIHCWSTYILDKLTSDQIHTILPQLPADSLIIDYRESKAWETIFGLAPKHILEDQVANEWRQVQQFLKSYRIDVSMLINDGLHDVNAMDDALDTLLGVSRQFLYVANEFQRALELARPLRISKELRSSHDALVLLAHRVQALSPGVFTQHFLETYSEDDTFFLYDNGRRKIALTGETLAEAFVRHMTAGRANLARALHAVAS